MIESGGFPPILEAARHGDPDALAALYRDIHPRVVRYLRAREPVEAEDLASDVWLDVASGLSGFEGDVHGFNAWVFTIARRRLIDLRRRRARRPQSSLEELSERREPAGDAEDEAVERLTTAEALARIATLPDEQADVVLLRVLGGLSVDEVAAIVGKRPGNVRVIQHRALRRLAREIESKGVTR